MRTIATASCPCEFARQLRRESQLSVLLDYDGTLVPFAPTPSRAAPDDDLLELLAAVAGRPNTDLEIVSGRDPSTLGRWFGSLPIRLRAEHGAWTRAREDGLWVAAVPIRTRAVREAGDHLESVAARLGGFIEYKATGATWHYRGRPIEADAIEEVIARATRTLSSIGFEIIPGACVVEARARGANKGRAVMEAMARTPGSTIIAIGDDTTDEDMFRALPNGIGIVVGDEHRATAASHRFRDPLDVRMFLSALVD